MSWEPGDLAECIDVRDLRLPFRHVALGGKYLKLGMFYIVQAVVADAAGEVLLDVGAKYGPKLAVRFRKVDPLSEDEAAEVTRDCGRAADA